MGVMSWQQSRRAFHFELEIISSASPERLFALLSDAPSWPVWFGPARKAEWATRGQGPDGNGTGAVRRVTIGGLSVLEAVLEEQFPTHHAYSIRTVLPVREHRADVWFEAGCGHTRIRWNTVFIPKVSGSGRLVAAGLRFGVKHLARSLITAAES
jgi:hypothetical protein